jgi:DNA invertase Pin-like site-specific DNA recombinase
MKQTRPDKASGSKQLKLVRQEDRKAAIYLRVSTRRQAAEGTSIDVQRERCKKLVADKGWELVGEFVEEAVSGTRGSRPALDKLMSDVRTGKVDAIIVAKLDRFGRSVRHLASLVGELDDRGVLFVSVADGFDSSTATGRMLRSILAAIAEFEMELIRERTMAGCEETARLGFWPGGPPPFGFRLVPPDREKGEKRGTTVAIDEAEAEVIRKAVSLILDEGQTTWQAAATLNALGLHPRGRRPGPGQPPLPGHFTHVNLRRLLLDGRIAGEWDYGRPTKHERGTSTMKFPAIIEPKRHALLMAALAKTSTGPRTPNRVYLLSNGILRGACGAPMFGVWRADRETRQYHCNNSRFELRNRNGASGGERCSCRNLPADKVEELVWDAVVATLSDPKKLQDLAAKYLAEDGDANASLADNAAKVDRRIAELEKVKGERIEAALEAGIDPKDLRGAIDSFNAKLETLRRRQRQLASAAGDSAVAAEGWSQLRKLAETARGRWDGFNAGERRAVLDLLQTSVKVIDWEPCPTCAGRGKVTGGARGGTPCPTCLMYKSVAILSVFFIGTPEVFIVGDPTALAARSSRC